MLPGLPLRVRMHPAPADDQHHQDDRGDRHQDQDDDKRPKRALGAGDPVIPLIDAVGQASSRQTDGRPHRPKVRWALRTPSETRP